MSTNIFSNTTGIASARPAQPIFGPGGFVPPRPGQARQPEQADIPGRPDDSTGLSISPEEMQRRRDQFAAGQEASAQERAYREAGARSGRATPEMLLMQSGGETAGAAAQASAPAALAPARPEQGERAPEQAETEDPLSSGGTEERSAERTFMGGMAAAQEAPRRPGSEAARKGGGQQQDQTGEEEEEGEKDGLNPELSEEEQQEVQKLKERDREVRTHEQAHMSAGGGLVAGGPSYETQTGPDGKSYATGGEVQIDTSKGSNPEDTIAKARRIKQAALAPAQPSAQDQKVAAKASQMESEARQEKTRERTDEGEQGEGGASGAQGAGKSASEPGGAQGAVENHAAPSPGMERLAAHAAHSYRRASGAELPAPLGIVQSFAV